jgi:hypothetical protein
MNAIHNIAGIGTAVCAAPLLANIFEAQPSNLGTGFTVIGVVNILFHILNTWQSNRAKKLEIQRMELERENHQKTIELIKSK